MLNLPLAAGMIDVQVNLARVDADLGRIRQRLAALPSSRTIAVRVDRAQATAGINLLRQQINSLQSAANVTARGSRAGRGGGGVATGAPGPLFGLNRLQVSGIAFQDQRAKAEGRVEDAAIRAAKRAGDATERAYDRGVQAAARAAEARARLEGKVEDAATRDAKRAGDAAEKTYDRAVEARAKLEAKVEDAATRAAKRAGDATEREYDRASAAKAQAAARAADTQAKLEGRVEDAAIRAAKRAGDATEREYEREVRAAARAADAQARLEGKVEDAAIRAAKRAGDATEKAYDRAVAAKAKAAQRAATVAAANAPGRQFGLGALQGLGIGGFAMTPAHMAGQAIGGAFGGGVMGSVRTAMELESSFADLQRVSGQTAAGMGTLKKALFDISTSQAGVSTADVIDIAGIGARMGVGDKEGVKGLETFTRSMAQVRNAVSGIGTDQLANQMARVLNLFGLGTDRIAGFGSALTQMDNVSTSTAADILDITTGLSGTAAAIGMTLPQVLAFSSVLKDVGLTNQLAASSFSQIFRMMASDSAGFAARIGVDAATFRNAYETDVMGALGMVIDKFKELQTGGSVGAQEWLAELGLRGVRTAGSMQQLAAKFDEVQKRAKVASAETSSLAALTAANELKSTTAESAMQKFKNAAVQLGDALANPLLPALTTATNAFVALAKAAAGAGGGEGLLSNLLGWWTSKPGTKPRADLDTQMQRLIFGDPEERNKQFKAKMAPLPESKPAADIGPMAGLPAVLKALPPATVAKMAADAGQFDLAARMFAEAARRTDEATTALAAGMAPFGTFARRRMMAEAIGGRAKPGEAGGGEDMEALIGRLFPEKPSVGVAISGEEMLRRFQEEALSPAEAQVDILKDIDKGIQELNAQAKERPGGLSIGPGLLA
jgi:TP901 family phage tail tape measure protein